LHSWRCSDPHVPCPKACLEIVNSGNRSDSGETNLMFGAFAFDVSTMHPLIAAQASRARWMAALLVAASLFGCGRIATPVRLSSVAPAGRTAPASSPTSPSCTTSDVLATWSLDRLTEQTIVVPVDENDVGAVKGEVAAGAGGVILFGGSAPADLGAELRSLNASAPGGLAPFVMTDEEGGAVQRMANLVGSIPSARQMGAIMTPVQVEDLARGLALRMRAAGVTMDLAPVLDLDAGQGPNDRDPVGTRSFSPDESTAAADGLAFARGLAAGGVVAVAKHFPGLGEAT